MQVYKNNSDFHGHSYGCHDNYLIPRSIPFPSLVEGMIPFLISRQVIAGAGKVGVEAQESGFVPGSYQLSQRADFMETDLSVDTMHNRPILNTRDEPHADPKKYRRMHLIIGDAKMCEYATALKVGMTQLVLELIGLNRSPKIEIEQPVVAVKHISRDSDLKAVVRQKNGQSLTGVEIQEQYYEAAEAAFAGSDPDTDWILREWRQTLSLLTTDRAKLVRRLDWVTKLWLLDTFMREERIGWDDPWLASLDLEYHNVNAERGLFLGLEAEGKAWRMTTEADIERALSVGPHDTRGGLRGLCVRRFPDQIKSMQWERIQFSGGLIPKTLEMGDLFDPEEVKACAVVLEAAKSPADAMTAWNRRKEARS